MCVWVWVLGEKECSYVARVCEQEHNAKNSLAGTLFYEQKFASTLCNLRSAVNSWSHSTVIFAYSPRFFMQ